MKGIILAGGAGSRLLPMTAAVSKQLLPVYDKPMIFYPLSVLLSAGICEILVISGPRFCESFRALLGNGERFGARIFYKEQERPDGIARAFLLGEEFVGGEPCALALGDNVFFGKGLKSALKRAAADARKGVNTLFCRPVDDVSPYSSVAFRGGVLTDIEEKPQGRAPGIAAVGLAFFGRGVMKYAKRVNESPRGEYELTDVYRALIADGGLCARVLGKGYSWFDAGTAGRLFAASAAVRAAQKKGMLIGSPEAEAYRNGRIGVSDLKRAAAAYKNSDYAEALARFAEKESRA